MNLITKVDKNQLINKIKEHLDEHLVLYAEAIEGYKTQVKKEIEKLDHKVHNNDFDQNPEKIFYSKDLPISYKKEYENAISALEWTKDVIIELNPEQFKNYVLNDWTWTDRFYVSNSVYSSGCMSKLG